MTSLEFSYGILWRLSFLDFHPFRTHFPSPWLTYCRSSDFLTWRNMVDLLLHRQSVLDTEKFWHLLWASLTSCNFSFFFHLYTFSYSWVCFLIKLFAGFLPFFFPPQQVPFTLKDWTKCWTSHVTTKGSHNSLPLTGMAACPWKG
jgi:hypothetical protein